MKQLGCLDVCVSDYFGGHENTVIAVPVDGKTTVEDVFLSIRDEVFSWSSEPDGYSFEDFDNAFSVALANNIDILNEIAYPELEVADDNEDWNVYAYFTVV